MSSKSVDHLKEVVKTLDGMEVGMAVKLFVDAVIVVISELEEKIEREKNEDQDRKD